MKYLKLDLKSCMNSHTIHKCACTVQLPLNTLHYERLIKLFFYNSFSSVNFVFKLLSSALELKMILSFVSF